MLLLSCTVIVKFGTEHGSIIAMLCAKFHNESSTEMDVIDERNVAMF